MIVSNDIFKIPHPTPPFLLAIHICSVVWQIVSPTASSSWSLIIIRINASLTSRRVNLTQVDHSPHTNKIIVVAAAPWISMPAMRSPTTSRFDLDRNPPYQINYRAKRCGKTITASKRRITFQFGFSLASAIASGVTAVDCRGEEHEVVLIWSHMSGKRELFMDGRQIHTSKGAMGNSEFMYSWALGNHILKITAHGSAPMGGGEANFRQFDLELDGMSYFTFKQIYQLGGDASGVRRLALTPSTIARPKQTESMMYKYVGAAVDDDDEEEYVVDETLSAAEVRAPVIDLFEREPHIETVVA